MQTAVALPPSDSLSAVELRVLKQLLEALLFEGQLDCLREACQPAGRQRFKLQLARQSYVVYGHIAGFDRVRIEPASLRASGISVDLLLADCDSNAAAIAKLQEELAQTVLLSEWNQSHLNLPHQRRNLSASKLEQAIDEGHLYHPCYKARTSFSIADHRLFGPEAGNSFQLHWLAIKRDLVRQQLPCSESAFWIKEIGQAAWDLLHERLRLKDADWDDYALLPIHPWQWLSLKQDLLKPWLDNGTALYLAAAGDSYQATQSVRSLMNQRYPHKAHVKLPMNMVNTSALRILEPHSVCSAPLVSDWLQQLVNADRFLSELRPLLILQEYAGMLVEPDDEQLQGQLAVIWRESIDKHIQPGEAAIPFNALLLTESDGRPFIHQWLERYSLQAWLKQLFDTSVLPVWHLLIQHGIAIEAHAQNLLLFHRDGMPSRLAARDFHESVEYVRNFLREPEREPDFISRDQRYQAAKPDEFYWMQDVEALRELFVDTLYIYNLAELAHLLEQHYDFSEQRFWRLLQTSLQQYADEVGIDPAREQRLGLQQKKFRTESLITRKLRYPQQAECHHVVSNPFYSV